MADHIEAIGNYGRKIIIHYGAKEATADLGDTLPKVVPAIRFDKVLRADERGLIIQSLVETELLENDLPGDDLLDRLPMAVDTLSFKGAIARKGKRAQTNYRWDVGAVNCMGVAVRYRFHKRAGFAAAHVGDASRSVYDYSNIKYMRDPSADMIGFAAILLAVTNINLRQNAVRPTMS